MPFALGRLPLALGGRLSLVLGGRLPLALGDRLPLALGRLPLGHGRGAGASGDGEAGGDGDVLGEAVAAGGNVVDVLAGVGGDAVAVELALRRELLGAEPALHVRHGLRGRRHLQRQDGNHGHESSSFSNSASFRNSSQVVCRSGACFALLWLASPY